MQRELLCEFIGAKMPECRVECHDSHQYGGNGQVRENPEQSRDVILWDYVDSSTAAFMEGLRHGDSGSAECKVLLFNVPGSWQSGNIALLGVSGAIEQESPPELLLRAIKAVAAGELWLPRKVISQALKEVSNRRTDQQPQVHLTAREIQILRLVASGYGNDAIGEKLCISTHTVKTHLYNCFRKIQVPNRVQASLWVQKNLRPEP